jgi:hypothetical protein
MQYLVAVRDVIDRNKMQNKLNRVLLFQFLFGAKEFFRASLSLFYFPVFAFLIRWNIDNDVNVCNVL